MGRRSVVRMSMVALATLAIVPAPLAFAQGIAGVVRDASGGALPGVTVEASSPALIEQTRTVVSDCFAVDSPQATLSGPAVTELPATPGIGPRAICDTRPPFQAQGKLLASVTLPWDLQVAGTFQTSPGPPILNTLVIVGGLLPWFPAVAAAQSATTGQVQARPTRTQDGRPNLNGIWQVLNTAAWDIQDHPARLGVPAGQGVVEGNDIPYQPWALTKKLENFKNRLAADLVEARGFLPGVPRVMYMPFPFQIVQTPKYISIVSEYSRALRIIYTDESTHPGGPIEFWMGDSRGRWEGETLVVDAIHFNDQTWFDRAGNFHSEALHLAERFTLMGPDHINYEVTVEDPKVFTRPWKMSMLLYRRKEPNVRILEYEAGMLLLEEEARRQDEQGRGR